MTRRPLAILLLTLLAMASYAGAAQAAACPGSPDPCPWSGAPEVFGDVSPESLRLAQDIAFDSTNGVIWIIDGESSELKRYNATTGALLGEVGSEGDGPGQFDFPGGLAVDASGNVYVADTGNNRVQKLNSSGVHQLTIGDGTQGTGNNQFILPADVAVDSGGNIFVADVGNQRIQKFNSAGTYQATIGGPGTGDGEFGDFASPGSLAIDSSNALYAADTANSRVQKFDATGAYVAQAGTSGPGLGEFNSLRHIAVDPTGTNLYAAEHGRLQSMDAATLTFGQNASEFAPGGTADGQVSGLVGVAASSTDVHTVEAFANGSGGINRAQRFDATGTPLLSFATDAAGQLLEPDAMAVDSSGNVYVADTNKDRVVRYLPDGTFDWAVGTRGSGDGEFIFPSGIATDGMDVWVADTGNGRIQRFDAATGAFEAEITSAGNWDANGSFLTQMALNGSDLYVADPGREVVWRASGGTVTVFHGTLDSAGTGTAELDSPRGVAVQGSSLWVSDTGNHRLRKVALADGTTQATVGSQGSGNDQLDLPQGITATADHLYVADFNNDRVQRLDTTGAFLDRWGEDGDELGEFSFPMGMAVAGGGIYVLDSGNDRVQRFDVGAPSIPPASTPVVTLNSVLPATSSTKPTFSGMASSAHPHDGQQVEVRIHFGSSTSNPIAMTLTATRSGSDWNANSSSWGGSSGLSDGVYTAVARQTNTSATPQTGTSATRTFEVDTTAPVVNLSNPVDNSETTSKRPAISGTAGNRAGLSPDSDITFELHRKLADGSFEHVNQGPIDHGFWTVAKAASFSTTIPTDLSTGTYHLRAYQHDAAGNHNPQDPRTSRLFTVKSAPLANLRVTTPAHEEHTRNRQPTIGGTTDTAGKVTIELKRWTGSAWVLVDNYEATASGGKWSKALPVQLQDAQYQVYAYQANSEGKFSNSPASFFFVDTVPPPKPTVTAPAAFPGEVGTKTPTFEGTADPHQGTNTVELELKGMAGDGRWVTLKTHTVPLVSGRWSFRPSDYVLNEGYFALFVLHKDKAGNGTYSDARNFQVNLDSKDADNPGKNSDMCQTSLDYGPFHVEGSCLKRRGLTWVSDVSAKINGVGFEPVGNGELVIDPFNLRIATNGRVRVVLGPAHICLPDQQHLCFRDHQVGPFVLYDGPFDWSWQGQVNLPERAEFGLPVWGGVDLPQLPGLAGFNLPQVDVAGWGRVNLPDFGAIRGIDIGKLTLPSLNAQEVALPDKYFGNFRFSLPAISVGTSGSNNLLGFPIDGRLSLTFEDQRVVIDAGLKLPQFLGSVSGSARVAVGLSGDLLAENLHLGVPYAPMGPIGFEDVAIDYDGARNLWNGRAKVNLPVPGGLALSASAGFQNGQLVNAEAGFDRDIAIANTGFFMYGGSIFFKTVPNRQVGGTIDAGLGPRVLGVSAVRLKSKITYTFDWPSSLRFDSGVSVVNVPLGQGFVEIFGDGTVDFGGRISRDFGAGFYVSAYVDGWLQIPQKRFNIDGGGEVHVGDWFEFGGDVTVSYKGVGGCANWNGNRFGATYAWGGSPNIMLSSCSVSAIKGVKKPTGRVAAGAVETVSIPAGHDAYVLGFQGVGGAPDVNLTGPKGESFSTVGKSGPSGGYLVIHAAEQDRTYVVIDEPSAGTWKAEVASGSVSLESVLRAETIEPPKIDAKVTGKGDARALEYDTSDVDAGQRVSFVELGPNGREAVIGEVGSGKGKLRFSPMAARSGMRAVKAVVTEDGFERFVLDKVAVFRASTPAPPAAPKRVTARRKKGKRTDTVAVSWTRIPGAGSYRVTTLINGRKSIFDTRKTRMTIPGLFDRSSASVSVAGVNAMGQVGKPAKAKLAAPKAKHPKKRSKKR